MNAMARLSLASTLHQPHHKSIVANWSDLFRMKTLILNTQGQDMSEILSTKTGGVLAIQFAREAKKNALTLDMYQQLTELLNQATQDEDIVVVSITGSDHCFSAGNDLADFLTAGPLDETHPVVQFLLAI